MAARQTKLRKEAPIVIHKTCIPTPAHNSCVDIAPTRVSMGKKNVHLKGK